MESTSTQSQEMISLIVEIMKTIECGYKGKENYWYKYFDAILDRLNKPHDLKKMAKEMMGLFGGMGTFNDLVLHKSQVTPLIEENDRLAEQKDRLFTLCKNILESDF